MPLSISGLIDILADLCEENNLRCAAKSCLKGGLLAGATTVLGGLLLGPVGLAIGGTLGGVAAAANSRNFQPVAVTLRNMSQEHKQRLYNKIKRAFQDFGPEDIAALAALLMSQESLRTIAIREVTNYLTQDMSLTVTRNLT